MATDVATGTGRPTSGWTPARIFMVFSIGYHVPLGIAGLLIDQSFPLGPNAAAEAGSALIFGVFRTNGWHSLAALILGVISVYFAARPAHARDAALAFGISHVVIVLSLILWDPSTFMLASNDADQVIHAITAIGGIGSALMTRPVLPRASAS